MERSRQNKKKSKLKQQYSSATNPPGYKHRQLEIQGGDQNHPCLESWELPAGEGKGSANHAAQHQHKDVHASSSTATGQGRELKGGYGEQGAPADPASIDLWITLTFNGSMPKEQMWL